VPHVTLPGLLIAVLGWSYGARTLHAQDHDPVAAQALFDEARTLMNSQRYAPACLKLAESQRLDPGIGTLFHLGVCYEHEGRLASAWAAFLEVASLATASGHEPRAQAAARRATLLEPRLPKLRLSVPAVARTGGLEITRDGNVVGEAQWGLAMPVDPGVHAIEVTAPARRAYALAIEVSEGASVSFEVPVLEAASAKPVPVAPPVVAAAPVAGQFVGSQVAAPDPAPVASTPARASGPGALAIGLGIGSVVALGAGVALGIVAQDKNSESKKRCEPAAPNRCSAQGVQLRDDAFLFSDLATAGYIVGAAALVSAGVAWLLHTDSEATPAPLGVSLNAGKASTYLTVSGTF
jgi:hypothetical protein